MPSGESVGAVTRPFSAVNCPIFMAAAGGNGDGRGRTRGQAIAATATSATIATATSSLTRRARAGHHGLRKLSKFDGHVVYAIEPPRGVLFQAARDHLVEPA